ncbi:MAG: pantoate--beta-alanine ligase [Bacteroidia bacterium]|nr:pantoate--beta-alanine ligase [Bacteroidia bacterium]MBT8267935.1 pantoate--beta-alanine ligase [Bacteroidia bacterium]NNK69831.1 pantoate--beta-alanine ligase [Flavobacteriaceae bacterium]
MKVFRQKANLDVTLDSLRRSNQKIGFVPTMGALHQGHLSLVRRALDENDKVVVSIFVNPTQFDNKEDLQKYPRTLETDVRLLETITKDDIIVYSPEVDDLYDTQVKAIDFNFKGLEQEMEGKFRTGHFDGVATVVSKLFDAVKPDKAYFGQKDFQQLLIIKKLVEILSLPVKVVGCDIMREEDGLAMSSRNVRLSEIHRQAAPFIYKTLKSARKKFGTKSADKVTKWVMDEFAENEYLDLEYFVIADASNLKRVKRKSKKKSYRAFIAAYAGDIRLIDNIALN